MSRSPGRDAAPSVDSALAAAMQRLTSDLSATTDIESRLAAALYAASLSPAPRVRMSLDTVLGQGRRELQATLEATTDVEGRLILALTEADLDADGRHGRHEENAAAPFRPGSRTA